MKRLFIGCALMSLASAASANCVQGHYIQEVMGDGKIIRLENDSLWQVDAVDTVDSMLWLPSESVVICSDGKMIDTDEESGNTVHVKLLSKE